MGPQAGQWIAYDSDQNEHIEIGYQKGVTEVQVVGDRNQIKDRSILKVVFGEMKQYNVDTNFSRPVKRDVSTNLPTQSLGSTPTMQSSVGITWKSDSEQSVS